MARRIPEQEAAALMRTASLEPLGPYPGSGAPWRCRCRECGEIVTPTYSRVRAGHGCRNCNRQRRGIDFISPAYVYVLFHSELELLKIGIASVMRMGGLLAARRDQGWGLFRKLLLPTGEDAFRVESAVLRRVRAEHGLPTPDVHAAAFGATEVFDADSITAWDLWQLISEEASRILLDPSTRAGTQPSDRHYETALDVISRTRDELERHPGLTEPTNEKRLRALLLVCLNVWFKGMAAGEAINGHGRTDILIRIAGRNILICECKIWRGPRGISKFVIFV